MLLRISRFAVFSLCCIRSLPNLRAPRTKTRRPHVNTQNQTSEPCSEGIRSMCLTQINCLPASLCLDTACSWVFRSPGGRRETCGPNKPPECCLSACPWACWLLWHSLKKVFLLFPIIIVRRISESLPKKIDGAALVKAGFRALLARRKDGDVGAQTHCSSPRPARLSHHSPLHPARPVMSCITCSVVGMSRVTRLYSIFVA